MSIRSKFSSTISERIGFVSYANISPVSIRCYLIIKSTSKNRVRTLNIASIKYSISLSYLSIRYCGCNYRRGLNIGSSKWSRNPSRRSAFTTIRPNKSSIVCIRSKSCESFRRSPYYFRSSIRIKFDFPRDFTTTWLVRQNVLRRLNVPILQR